MPPIKILFITHSQRCIYRSIFDSLRRCNAEPDRAHGKPIELYGTGAPVHPYAVIALAEVGAIAKSNQHAHVEVHFRPAYASGHTAGPAGHGFIDEPLRKVESIAVHWPRTRVPPDFHGGQVEQRGEPTCRREGLRGAAGDAGVDVRSLRPQPEAPNAARFNPCRRSAPGDAKSPSQSGTNFSLA